MVRSSGRQFAILVCCLYVEERQQAPQTRYDKFVAGVPPIVNLENQWIGKNIAHRVHAQSEYSDGAIELHRPDGESWFDHMLFRVVRRRFSMQAVADYLLESIALQTKSSS